MDDDARIHVDVVGGKVERDEELEQEGEPRVGGCEEAEEARGHASVGRVRKECELVSPSIWLVRCTVSLPNGAKTSRSGVEQESELTCL